MKRLMQSTAGELLGILEGLQRSSTKVAYSFVNSGKRPSEPFDVKINKVTFGWKPGDTTLSLHLGGFGQNFSLHEAGSRSHGRHDWIVEFELRGKTLHLRLTNSLPEVSTQALSFV